MLDLAALAIRAILLAVGTHGRTNTVTSRSMRLLSDLCVKRDGKGYYHK